MPEPDSLMFVLWCHIFWVRKWYSFIFFLTNMEWSHRFRYSLRGVRTECQPDKMPTRQNANQRLAFCLDFFLWLAFRPDFFLWLAFCPSQFLVDILSWTSQHVLALCPNHEKCLNALSIKDPGMWIPWGHQVGLMSFDDKSYVPVHKWFRFFWRTNGSTGGM